MLLDTCTHQHDPIGLVVPFEMPVLLVRLGLHRSARLRGGPQKLRLQVVPPLLMAR
jgi:hypothetical protein